MHGSEPPIGGVTEPPSLEARIIGLMRLAAQPIATTDDLARMLVDVYQAILATGLDAYDPVATQAAAPVHMHGLFRLRLQLRGRLAEWQKAGLMNHDTQLALRNALRALRFGSDMLGELSIGFVRLPAGAAAGKAFSGEINTMVNPAFDTDANAAFRTGDVLLLRGIHHNSAAIARIGDVDSQFSHVCMVHIGDDGRQWVVESLIEEGAIINTLAQALTHGSGRAILLRHPDAELAKRAAKIAYNHVARSRRFWRRRILYDFTMRLDRRRPLFCSKLVRLAFDRASQGRVLLPTFFTRFDLKNRDFIDRIGVQAIETYAPGDTEIEPALDIVAEWADYRVTSRLRTQDLIMVKLFEWMELYGYTFKQDFMITIISLFGRLAAHLSDDAKTLLADVVPKVPINMGRKTIAAIAMLHKTAEPLLDAIQAFEADQIARTGQPLHPRQIYEELEKIRQRSDGRIGYLVAPAGSVAAVPARLSKAAA